MFDIGFWEIAVIVVIALVVLGPERLPEVARTAGRWMGRARHFIDSVKADLKEEIESEDLAEFRKLHSELAQTREVLQDSSRTLMREIDQGLGDASATAPAAADTESLPDAGESSGEDDAETSTNDSVQADAHVKP